MTTQLQEATAFIKKQLSEKPQVGLILGSGLGMLADEIEQPVKIKYDVIPGFPVSTVEGHAGQLVIGELEGVSVIAMQGRFHFYEGYGLDAVTFPVRVMKQLGVEKLFVTNAAGGVNEAFEPGNLMLITDHINNTGQNPLIGPNDNDQGVRFPDLSQAYDRNLQRLAKDVAKELSLDLKEGVYVWNTGPTYETPAEIKILQTVGGDAVGMSTVPEVIVARHVGLEVLGISCISNMAAGILDQPLNHEEVIETTEKVREDFLRFVKMILSKVSA
ncbi:purine nucleoside phosphorylase 1 [Halolactibacillus alkaliphilus]|uniref:Purine nucleoside phosphorylase n=1 Tax=Halolactibacillus alkaliphilus TaxID=442899 RepID=A0A511X085_9BACI|nr:purine-nucleoside phosphorylase [Halolactibacillus alkaliphilus]GEN56330.1 purine nucleoside phosphorylase 1 [Halolactibacillus alkaliphilus]GGN67662.1 purine nucleoside phosphorylase 1 [Halolactibacillus alkaliphilus]SFO78901.1 purine-nucleoside phosphorylase [Halolactibacillus alkaliphilus]